MEIRCELLVESLARAPRTLEEFLTKRRQAGVGAPRILTIDKNDTRSFEPPNSLRERAALPPGRPGNRHETTSPTVNRQERLEIDRSQAERSEHKIVRTLHRLIRTPAEYEERFAGFHTKSVPVAVAPTTVGLAILHPSDATTISSVAVA